MTILGPTVLAPLPFYLRQVQLLVSRRWNPRVVAGRQSLLLRRRIAEAAAHVPFYRDHFRRWSIDPDAIRTREDLWRIPPVTKEDMLAYGRDGCLDERFGDSRFFTDWTSGTTGQTLKIPGHKAETDRMIASWWAPYIAHGANPGDRVLGIGADFLYRPVPLLHAHTVRSRTPMGSMEELVIRHRPTILTGFSELLSLLGKRLAGSPHLRRIRRVFTFGQCLTPSLRSGLQRAFAVDPIDLYGCTEAQWLGVQCRERTLYHVPEERNIVQTAAEGRPDRPAGPGAEGELIVTALDRQTFPFIRYRLRDHGSLVLGKCRCGLEGLQIRSVLGRQEELLVTDSGSRVSSSSTGIWELHDREVISDFRIRQPKPRRVEVQVVPGPRFDGGHLRQMNETIDRLLGFHVNVRRVATLPASAEPKRQRTVSFASATD